MTKAFVWPETIEARLREKTNSRPTCPLEGERDYLKVKAHRMTAGRWMPTPTQAQRRSEEYQMRGSYLVTGSDS